MTEQTEWRAEPELGRRGELGFWQVIDEDTEEVILTAIPNETRARLFAAAPAMAYALKRLADTVDPPGPGGAIEDYFVEPIKTARAALTKAGKAPK